MKNAMKPALNEGASPMPAHPYCEQDGVTHILIDNRGRTRLGQLMSPLAHTPFVHPVFGPFNSMEGFWAYLRSQSVNDKLRYVHGMAARHQNRNLETRYVKYFQEIILEATIMKIEQNPELLELVKGCDLPFETYYIFSGADKYSTNVKVNTKSAPWLVPAMEEARRHIKLGTRPKTVDYADAIHQS